jgi:hypothetical protein
MVRTFGGIQSTEIIFHSVLLVKKNLRDEITFTL